MKLMLFTDAAYNTSISKTACAISCDIKENESHLYQMAKVYAAPMSTEYEALATLYGLDCIINLYPRQVEELVIHTDHQGNAHTLDKIVRTVYSNWQDTKFIKGLTPPMKLAFNKLKKLKAINQGILIKVQWIPRTQNTLCDAMAVDKLQEYDYINNFQSDIKKLILHDLKKLEEKYLRYITDQRLPKYIKVLHKCYSIIEQLGTSNKK